LSRFVVDASVAVKWYLPEIHADAAARWLARDAAFLAPDLIYAEFGNVLWKRVRSKELARSEARDIARAFRLVPVEVLPCEALLTPALEIACVLGRSLYDCLYLALALDRQCDLITADEEFFLAVHQAFPFVQLLV